MPPTSSLNLPSKREWPEIKDCFLVLGLWNMVFLDCVSIRRAPRAVNRMLDGRVGGRRRGRPRYSPTLQGAGSAGGRLRTTPHTTT